MRQLLAGLTNEETGTLIELLEKGIRAASQPAGVRGPASVPEEHHE